MNEKNFKIVINIIIFVIALRIFISTKNNLSEWEKASEFKFMTEDKPFENCTIPNIIKLNQNVVRKLDELRVISLFK